jgi:hypothetical protein
MSQPLASDFQYDLSFVFPCLNEEKTIGECIEQVAKTLGTEENLRFEIIVADNGSSDRSREIALSKGAIVVPVAIRGYGAALQQGIQSAKGEYVIFADADNTYIYNDCLRLYKATKEAKADMGIASRLRGTIEPGAMPFLHRHLGTPVLTALINTLFRGSISDCNSGYRCVKGRSYRAWNIRSTGMEFASELLIKALKAKAGIIEIPSGLRPDVAGRIPHLKTWRDGMRHLLFILSEKPSLFEHVGILLLLLSTFLQITASITGPISIVGMNIFDVHSQALLLLGGILGTQFFLFSCICYLGSDTRPSKQTSWLIYMDEGRLFFILAAALTLTAAGVLYTVLIWERAGFEGLQLKSKLFTFIHLLSVLMLTAFGLLGTHIVKRYEKPEGRRVR